MDALYKELKSWSSVCTENEKRFIDLYLETSMIEGLLRENPKNVKTPIAYCNYIIVDDYFYEHLIEYRSFQEIKKKIKLKVIRIKRLGATYLKCFVGYTEKDMIP